MRQAHPGGERMFVDYAGQTVDMIDAGTGEARPARTFIAVMGASNRAYTEATLTQSLARLDRRAYRLHGRRAGAARLVIRFSRFRTGTETSRRVF
jgi:transposase